MDTHRTELIHCLIDQVNKCEKLKGNTVITLTEITEKTYAYERGVFDKFYLSNRSEYDKRLNERIQKIQDVNRELETPLQRQRSEEKDVLAHLIHAVQNKIYLRPLSLDEVRNQVEEKEAPIFNEYFYTDFKKYLELLQTMLEEVRAQLRGLETLDLTSGAFKAEVDEKKNKVEVIMIFNRHEPLVKDFAQCYQHIAEAMSVKDKINHRRYCMYVKHMDFDSLFENTCRTHLDCSSQRGMEIYKQSKNPKEFSLMIRRLFLVRLLLNKDKDVIKSRIPKDEAVRMLNTYDSFLDGKVVMDQIKAVHRKDFIWLHKYKILQTSEEACKEMLGITFDEAINLFDLHDPLILVELYMDRHEGRPPQTVQQKCKRVSELIGGRERLSTNKKNKKGAS